jgi:hypothetical protein
MPNKPTNTLYEKLSPTALRTIGLSDKSERYRNISTGQIISKRQYQKTLESRQGKSNERIAREYREGKRQYTTPGAEKAARARKEQTSGIRNLQYYIRELTSNGKIVNLDQLQEAYRLSPEGFKKLLESDAKILASRKWGKVIKGIDGKIKYPIEEELDGDYEDDLTPFFYH